jgi:hypothetical protein
MRSTPRKAFLILTVSLFAVASATVAQAAPTSKRDPKQSNTTAPIQQGEDQLATLQQSAAAAERSAAAAERASMAAVLSANAAHRSANTAKAQFWVSVTAAVLTLLALLSPYLLFGLQRKVQSERANKAAKAAIQATCDICRAARSRHLDSEKPTDTEIAADMTTLAVNRALLEVYLKAGVASHELLHALAEAFQVNYATRDALEMRRRGPENRAHELEHSNPNNRADKLTRSNDVLRQIEGRLTPLQAVLGSGRKAGSQSSA